MGFPGRPLGFYEYYLLLHEWILYERSESVFFLCVNRKYTQLVVGHGHQHNTRNSFCVSHEHDPRLFVIVVVTFVVCVAMTMNMKGTALEERFKYVLHIRMAP